jgi:hypothetical protein
MRSAIPLLALLSVSLPGLSAQKTQPQAPAGKEDWTSTFAVENGELTTTGRNPFFVLEPGYQLVLEGGSARLTITVLGETRTLAGVETRVVEERETNSGKLVEVSRNYFAISKRTASVYYFGEDVDIYKNGKVTGHEGGWLAGVNGARFGLMMPGEPRVKERYYQEFAPEIAMDRAEIVSASRTVSTPAGVFRNCLETAETSPLEPGTKEAKYYAGGIGLVREGALKLVRHGMVVHSAGYAPPAGHTPEMLSNHAAHGSQNDDEGEQHHR